MIITKRRKKKEITTYKETNAQKCTCVEILSGCMKGMVYMKIVGIAMTAHTHTHTLTI